MESFKQVVFRNWLLLVMLVFVLVSLAWASTPNCPHEYTLSADGTKCMQDVAPTCSQGTWNGSACVVQTTTHYNCPTGTTYDAELHKCISFSERTCPEGMTYSTSLNKCAQPPTCPEGMTLDATVHKCVQTPTCPGGMTYSASRHQCEANASCPSGYAYESVSKKCRRLQTPTCPSESYWSSANQACMKSTPTGTAPVCPSGTSWNADRKVCEKAGPTPSCEAGKTLQNGQCVGHVGTAQ